MARLTAVVPFTYAARGLSAGDVFEASDKDATLLKLVGRAVDAVLPSRVLRTRDLEPEQAGDESDADAAPVPRVKRKYTRRDMTAER